MKGKVVEWNDAKGYGFISNEDKSVRAFFHISAIMNNSVRPKVKDKVIFELRKDEKGRKKAYNIEITSMKTISLTVLFGCSFLVFMCASTITFGGLLFLIPIYFVLSVFTYFSFEWDKLAATSGSQRTPENTLHILSLAGGWPGALIAQNQLRHKSKKQPFKTILWFSVVLNIAAFIWTLTPSGLMAIENVSSHLLGG
mgnify:CR=1 FL=1